MASLQKDLRFSTTGKTIRTQTNHIVMNVWDYFDREAKKARPTSGTLTEKVDKATGEYTCAMASHFHPLF